MIFLKRALLFLIIISNVASLNAMERKQVADLLELYPVPNIANSWFAYVCGCDQDRTDAHRHAVKQAYRKRDIFKAEVFKYVHEGYKERPFSLWFCTSVKKRERRGKKLLNTALRSKRDDLAFLLLVHLACDNHHELMRFAANSVCPQEAIMLLQKHGVDIDALNSSGYTLLGSLASMGRRSAVNILLSCGADVNHGYSPLFQIWQSQRLHGPTQTRHKMISLLLAHGASIDTSDGSIHTDEFNQVKDGTVFYHAIETNDQKILRKLLREALFEPTTRQIVARKKRIVTVLCLFNRLKLARDIQFLLLRHMQDEVCTKDHVVWLANRGVSLEQLVPHCRFSWLKQMSQEAGQEQRSLLLAKLVPLIVQHRMGKVAELLSRKWLIDLYSLNVLGWRFNRFDIIPEILVVLDPAQVEQHRAGIEQNVRNALV